MGLLRNFTLAAALLAGGAISFPAAVRAADPAPLSPALEYLVEQEAAADTKDPARTVPSIPLTLRFDSALDEDDVAALEAAGLAFERDASGPVHLGPVYPVRVAPASISKVGELPGLEWAESGWRPGLTPCLNVSREELKVPEVWRLGEESGLGLTGRGILIATFDTGIDLYHPAFWAPDGDTLEWVDVDGSRTFTPGVDGADFNGDGRIGPDEVLRFWDSKVEDPHGLISNRPGEYDADRDWLYRDGNANQTRDVGREFGFTEKDPAFGEPVFLVIDKNGDRTLDLGEPIVALGTCKVRAVLDPGSKERRRGRDLIWADRDRNGHGTSVAGILVGEAPGRLLAGVAPGAELVVANAFAGVDLSQLILWALDQRADVMLHELATWVWDYLDGSSNAELMIDLAAAKGVTQVVPAGNLAGSGKHCRSVATPGTPLEIRMSCPSGEGTETVWGSILWRASGTDLRVRLRSPWNAWATLSGNGTQVTGGARVWSSRGTSPRGTSGLFFSIEADRALDGEWLLEILSSDGEVTVDGYVTDDQSTWLGGTVFLDCVSDEGTVTWPANADSAITVASYGTRGIGVPAGNLSRFSSRGPRIDGAAAVDLAAPGNYDVRTCRSGGLAGVGIGSYTAFGGTSAAAAHAAGVAALILNANPDLRHAGVRYVLTETAVADDATGDVPNDAWGSGKIDALSAVAMALDIEVPPFVDPAGRPKTVSLSQNFPNPFNPETSIRFHTDAYGEVSLKVFDVQGRLIRVLVDRYLSSGEWETRWDGTDRFGERVASGFYFYRLESRDDAESRKMLLLE